MTKKIKAYLLKLWLIIPFGYICRFWKDDMRITFYKTGWIVIDSGRNTVKDALPVNLVSQRLVDEIEERMKSIGYT